MNVHPTLLLIVVHVFAAPYIFGRRAQPPDQGVLVMKSLKVCSMLTIHDRMGWAYVTVAVPIGGVAMYSI